MTKAEEITICRTLADQFGDNSYLGPWLKEIALEIEVNISDDFAIAPTLKETRRVCDQLLSDTKKKMAELEAAARKTAMQIENAAIERAESIRASLAARIRQADRAMNEW